MAYGIPDNLANEQELNSANLNPIYYPQAYDQVVICGVTNPGIAVISAVSRTHEWDIKKGKGTTGATVTYVQKPPAKFNITFKLWLAEHFETWVTFRSFFKYDTTRSPSNAIDIYHPVLADLDITSVVVEGLGGLYHEGDGLWTVKVDLIEYMPPEKTSATSTPNGSKSDNGANGGGSTTPGDTGKSAYDDEIAAQQKEMDNLLGKL